jgi:DNA-binding beta-propeller fold protein YncE
LLLSCLASPALAGTVSNDRPLLGSFDGHDTTAGPFTQPEAIAVDEASGNVYVLNVAGSGQGTGPEQDPSHRVIDKFNAEGEAALFSAGNAAGKSSLDGSETPGGGFGVEGFFETSSVNTDIAVDSSGVNPGRIYVSEESGPAYAFGPGGNYLWTLPREKEGVEVTEGACGIAVDGEGHLWVAARQEGTAKALEYASSGSPPALLDSLELTANPEFSCRPGLDEGGNFYVASTQGAGTTSLDKYVSGGFASALGSEGFWDIAIDQSQPGGHIFGVQSSAFKELETSGTQLGSFGHDLIGNGRGIAYNPASDRVYVSDIASGTVKIFAAKASGTVPDVSIQATDGITQTEAIAHGTANPQSVANSYHFEYKPGEGASWATATTPSGCLPAPPLPEDSTDHAVSCKLGPLKANTTYQVRLVGTNTENHLSAYSAPNTFKTLAPPPPSVEACEATAVTTESAHVACTVNPKKDATTWRILKVAKSHAGIAECEALPDGGFTTVKEGTIPIGEPGTVAIGGDLASLLPAQTYCVRVIATNSGGSGKAELKFTTVAIVPSDVATAFAAPRTQTGARLVGYVNPQGSPLSYHFEYSADGGTTWTALPVLEDTSEKRTTIAVAQELGELIPATSYSYRFLVENATGAASPQGEEKTFSTRTAAEMALPARGMELVNQPEKGNQNPVIHPLVQSGRPFTGNGAGSGEPEVLWAVRAGAPGSPTGAGGIFISNRGGAGWHSRSLLPGADLLPGEGEIGYTALGATADFAHFLISPGVIPTYTPPRAAVYRYDAAQHPDLLFEYPADDQHNKILDGRTDSTADMAHVVRINRTTRTLTEVGGESEEVIGLLPDGSEPPCGFEPELGSAHLVSSATFFDGGYHWIATTDASRVYFKVQSGSVCNSAPYNLYVRDRGADKTTLVARAQGVEDVNFIRASADGQIAYFVTSGNCRKYSEADETVCETSEAGDTNGDPDIYRWEEASGESSCLTCGVLDADVSLPVMISDDFSHIYFRSPNRLIPGLGVAGNQNLYVLRGGELGFVALDGSLDEGGGGEQGRLSADGNVLLFKSNKAPSGEQIASSCGEQPCTELYRYDDADGSLECISCLHGGTTTESVGGEDGFQSNDVESDLTSDGGTVVFSTAQALLSTDVNGRIDIYEWHNGALGLVTDGVTKFKRGTAAPGLVGIDGNARDVFFTVAQPGLTGFEQDILANLYDARIGGGFEPPTPPAHCIEDSCQGPLQPAPALNQPGSSSYSGLGNLEGGGKKPPRCAKGKVRRHKRCLGRKHHKQHKRAGSATTGRAK